MIALNKLITVSRTTEVDAVSILFIKVYKKNDWSKDKHLTKIFNELEGLSENLTTAINRSKALSLLEEKDEVRDHKIRALHHFLDGMIYHPEQKIQTAAQAVWEVFKRYSLSIASKNYATETSLIHSLIEDLADESLKPSIATLSGCAELIKALQEAQKDFEKTRVEYEEEKAMESTKESASVIKYKLVKIINEKLITYLRAMVQVDEAQYAPLARTLAAIISDNNEMVKKRRHRGPSST